MTFPLEHLQEAERDVYNALLELQTAWKKRLGESGAPIGNIEIEEHYGIPEATLFVRATYRAELTRHRSTDGWFWTLLQGTRRLATHHTGTRSLLIRLSGHIDSQLWEDARRADDESIPVRWGLT